MPDFTDFAPLYDFSLIEKGIQKLFITDGADIFVQPPDNNDATRETWTPAGGMVAFFTAFQNATFTKARPRVSALVNNINPLTPLRRVADANNVLQIEWWRARLTLQVITKPDYAYHMELRSNVLALAVQIAPQTGGTPTGPVGANVHLDYHEITGCDPSDISAGLEIASGYYLSPISFNLDFAVRPDKWPGGADITPA